MGAFRDWWADLNSRLIQDAARKATSVRALRRTSVRLPGVLHRLTLDQHLDLGCALQQGNLEVLSSDIRLSTPEESLILFIFRLLERLRALGAARAPDLMQYGCSLASFAEDSPPPALSRTTRC